MLRFLPHNSFNFIPLRSRCTPFSRLSMASPSIYVALSSLCSPGCLTAIKRFRLAGLHQIQKNEMPRKYPMNSINPDVMCNFIFVPYESFKYDIANF